MQLIRKKRRKKYTRN